MTLLRKFLNRWAFVAAVAFVAFAGLAPANAQSIEIRGTQRVDAETVRSYFSGTDAERINKGVKELYATGLFSDVKTTREGGRIVVTVVENQMVNRVAFEGNSKIKSEVLSSEVQSKSRGAYNPATVRADVERISDLYRRGGRSDATVSSRIVPLENGRVDIVFTVDEGSKTGVKSINFVGNSAIGSYRLRNLMQTTEMNFMSFLKSTDVYDPDRIASDEELIRRFYLKNGYADFRIVGSDAVYDPAQKGYIVTITVDEGQQYHVASVNVESTLSQIPQADLMRAVRVSPGDVYNGDLVDKSTEAITREVARHGYAFASAKPRGDRDPGTATIRLSFVVEEGPRAYVERINIRGNTRTRDYVIRREFPLGEGDAYNRALVDKAEKRLNNLGFFKKVKITTEPGSSPDRVVINVDVEDQPTGSFGISGGYSTVDGIVAEVSLSESNFMGRGQYARAAVTGGLRTRGIEFNFTEPYFLDYRLAAGFDLFVKSSTNNQYAIYDSKTYGGTLRLGVPLTEELSFSPRYSLSSTSISVPNSATRPYADCTNPQGYFGSPGVTNPDGTVGATDVYNCLSNGEASLAIKDLAYRTPIVVSSAGYSLTYNTLDNNKNPTEGAYGEFRQDLAGLGGTTKYLRSSLEGRYFYPIWDDVVGFVKVQAGHEVGYGGYQPSVVDQFNLGPSLVRGFAPGGLGPRDISNPYSSLSAGLGGTKYIGASAEIQFPIFGLPKDLGLKGAIFADAGTLFGYAGKTNFYQAFNQYQASAASPTNCVAAPTYTNPGTGVTSIVGQGSCIQVADSNKIRASVGASILWTSPLGPIRFDYAFVLSQYRGFISPVTGTRVGADQLQAFRFSGGGSF